MSRIAIALCLVPAMLAGGCARHRIGPAEAASATPEPEPAWRGAMAAADAARIDALAETWRGVWTLASRRATRALMAEGPLLQADAALDHPALPPGSYRCRSIVVTRDVVRKSPPFFCYVGGERGGKVSFTKQTGTALPGGWLYPDAPRRYVFVGARQRRVGDNSIGYGDDASRNLVGVVERIGAFRWRLVLPGAEFQLYELTPVPVERQGPTG